MKRFLLLTFQFFILIILMTGCSENIYEKSIEDELQVAMSKANIQFQEIYHLEVVKDGILVFYGNDQGLNAGFIRNKNNRWKWVFGGGSASLEPKEGLSWHVSNHPDIPLCYAYGVVANPEIEKVRTVYADFDSGIQKENKAKLVALEKGTRIWFVLYDRPIKFTGNFIGLSNNDEVLYQYKK